ELQRGTILANLAPGVAQPDVERLVALCRETGLMDFVDRQPQGLLTPLMEGAPNLSGGQRQKVAIVRALYRDAPIVLLDEPSSALDAEAEGAIVALLERLREKGRTVVLAAHSRRLLTAADQVLHLDDGRLREVEVRDAELAGPITADMHTFLPS
ncbi:MAG: ATP-binding cassette domain-containing protein, partial [Opitutales bacterium]